MTILNKTRWKYFILICCTIFLGLLSRKILFVPLFIGDMLWAIMMFFIIRFIRINADIKVISLMICYIVEISQLYQGKWIVEIRKTLPGKLILGQGFLWTDIISYTIGIIIITLFFS